MMTNPPPRAEGCSLISPSAESDLLPLLSVGVSRSTPGALQIHVRLPVQTTHASPPHDNYPKHRNPRHTEKSEK